MDPSGVTDELKQAWGELVCLFFEKKCRQDLEFILTNFGSIYTLFLPVCTSILSGELDTQVFKDVEDRCATHLSVFNSVEFKAAMRAAELAEGGDHPVVITMRQERDASQKCVRAAKKMAESVGRGWITAWRARAPEEATQQRIEL